MPTTPLGGLPPNARPDQAWITEEVAAGSSVLNAVLAVPVPGEWFLRAITIALNYLSSAVVARRVPTLQLLDANGALQFQIPAAFGQDASVLSGYYWFPGMSATVGAANAVQAGPWPDVTIPPGWQIRAFAQTAQVGDTIGPLRVYGEHIPTGPEQALALVTPLPLAV